MSVLAQYFKYAAETPDYQIDWSDWLGTDTISSSNWSSSPAGLTLTGSSTTTTATVKVSGGTAGINYTLTNTITTAGGLTGIREIAVQCSAARAGMRALIEQLRGMCHAGHDDYTIGGTTYWSDDQLQTRLDDTRVDSKLVALEAAPDYVDGVYQYFDYHIPETVGRWLEQNSSSNAFVVRTTNGAAISTSLYTVDYAARIIRFSSNQAGVNYTLDCREYNLNRAAAAVWEEKAAAAAGNVDWKTDNHTISASQEYAQCMAMAAQFKRRAGIKTGRLVRTDESY